MRVYRGIPRITPSFQPIRHFHQTRPAPFINEALDLSSSFIHGVHSVSGLSWALSVPLTALLVRLTVAMPLQIFTQVNARKEREIAPFLQSWIQHYKVQAKKKASSSPDDPIAPRQALNIAVKDIWKQHKLLKRRWGVSRFWKPANFFQLPIWISIMESLRAMSGNNNGLVPYLLSCLEPASSSTEAGQSLHLAVEPSFATEGALWFPDLLAGDSTGILPAVLTLSILLNVHIGWKGPAIQDLADLPRLEMAKHLTVRTLKLLVQVLALNIGISSYAYEMPAALMIYWISSTNIATLQTFLLGKYMFPTPTWKPWKPVYLKIDRSRQGNPSLGN